MIVNKLDNGTLELIYQPAHAAMSAQIAARWQWDTLPDRWHETLIAISQHDNGWYESEIDPTQTDEGRPCNFTERKTEEAIAQWRRGVARGAHQSRWIGLLIARHAWRLYSPDRGTEAQQDAWLDELDAQMRRWRGQLGVTEAEIERADAMMRLTDWFSLSLCWRRMPENGDAHSLGTGPDGTPYSVRKVGPRRVVVEPWPFTLSEFAIDVEVRTLPQTTYSTQDALLNAMRDTTPEQREWTLVKAA